jgi:nucleotide-binding universal stress UspA family protein
LEPCVVVGVNESGTALRAVRWAAVEAHRRRVALRIVHAAPQALGNALDKRRAASTLALARTVAVHAQPLVPTHTEVVFDRPVRVLIAATEAARLLVVGMGSGTGFDDVPVRSLALDVCAAASCPVVVVRGADGSTPTDAPVVLGLDDVDRDTAAITAAFADADGPATRLVVVHALRGPDAVLDALAGHPASARAEAEEEIMTALSPWRSRHPDVSVEVRVVHGAPSVRLLEATAQARLLVVGTKVRGPAARASLGSTSRTVLRRSPCPVMVVPREAHVLDLEAQDTAQRVVDAALTAPTSGSPQPHDRSELW